MNKLALHLISAFLTVLLPYPSLAQQAEAPVYKEGDWWKVKVEFKHSKGIFNRSGECFESYPEFLVKIEQGKPRVYGISDPVQEEIDCPEVAGEVLGGNFWPLKFPLRVDQSWQHQYLSFETERWNFIDFKVESLEEVQTPKGRFKAYKITGEHDVEVERGGVITQYEFIGKATQTYYFSPELKAIVLLDFDHPYFRRMVKIVDSNLVGSRTGQKGPPIAKKSLESQQVAKPQMKQQTSTPPRPGAEVAVPSQPTKPRQVTQPPIPKREGKRFAVVIGIGNYQNASIPDLAYAAVDAQSIYDLLTDPSRGGYSKENVKLLLGREATRRNIVAAIGSWLFRRVGPDDEVFVYYAGHGAVESDRTGTEADGLAKYLVPADAVPQELFVTGISNGELARMFQALKTKRFVFFLDSCYSAGTTGLGRALTATGFRAGSLSSDLYGNLAGSGQAIVAAAKPNQVALELPEFSHGLFTKFVLDGLQGRADANGDGLVTLLELYPYLSKEVPRVARQKGAIQEPVLRSSISGDLVLSSVPETLQKLSIEARVERLKKLYTEGTISAKQLEKAVKILKTGQSNRMLEDFFKGEISTSTFKDLF